MPIFFTIFFYYFYISIEGNTIRFSYSKFCYERSECTNHDVKIKVTKKLTFLTNKIDPSGWILKLV